MVTKKSEENNDDMNVGSGLQMPNSDITIDTGLKMPGFENVTLPSFNDNEEQEKPASKSIPESEPEWIAKSKKSITINKKSEDGKIVDTFEMRSHYDLPKLDLVQSSETPGIVAAEGLMAQWYPLKDIGQARRLGYKVVEGMDNPYILNSDSYELMPNTNFLTCDGGQNVIVVCVEAEWQQQINEKAAKFNETYMPKITKETLS